MLMQNKEQCCKSSFGNAVLGIPAPHARTGGVLIVAQRRVKHTDTIFYVVRQNRLHPRERFILLEIEKGYNKYMEEEDYIHSTLLPALTHNC